MSYVEMLEKGIENEAREVERLQDEVQKIGKVLNKRSRTLYKLLALKIAYFNLYAPHMTFLHQADFQAKRGRKSYIPIKEVMHILKIGHRQAQDYVRVWKALKLIDEWVEHKTTFYKGMRMLEVAKEGTF